MTSGLIGAGLIGIIISAFSITLNSFQQSSRALAQKMEISQLQANIKGRLADGVLCACNLNHTAPIPNSGITADFQDDDRQGVVGSSADETGFTLELRALYGRCANNQPSNPIVRTGEPVADSLTNLDVEEVRVVRFRRLSASTVTADLNVRFDSEGLVISRKPILIPLTLQTSVSGGTLRVLSCTTQEPPAPANGIPPALAGDPGTQCRYGGNPNGPTGLTMYRTATEGLARLCCVTSVGPNGELFKCQ